ncbi:hypothetical protein [Peptostreptococcus equinus]|uniref:DNA-binding protein n=1 Tax=Peptostreptococcus equinus TaxID=3003601 RepID=A0ABY7JT63_9FIRM|nr:hypothetical protein [Peptostreptococcus sp. CBA3647]WAW15243.1 hypothetical protein O0R46_01990 [Peptostreptococcus sp. CBA3647]
MSEYYVTCKEVMEITGCKDTTAYNLIRKCNEELKEKGFLVRRGKTPRKYFLERIGAEEKGV